MTTLLRTCGLRLSVLLLWGLVRSTTSYAQVWQWSVPVQEVVSTETNGHPRAFLWIPPRCKQVRAVVVGQHNMLEEGVLEHPRFRQELAEIGIAEVWVTPALDMVFDFQKGAGEKFDGMMRTLAQESGYQELAFVPVVPIGHSAAASYPWNFAAWNPDRTLAAISLKGDAPLTNLTGSGRPNPAWEQRTLDGVPGLMVVGEYEWMEARMQPALTYRQQHPAAPVSLLVNVGRGHFDYSDWLVEYLGLFIRKATQQRLPAHASFKQPAVLKPIVPQQGWLADRWRPDAPPQALAASFAYYSGNKAEAFWYFDKEIAETTERHYAAMRGKKPQLLGYVQQGNVRPQTSTHSQISLISSPLPDGVSFQVSSVFLDSVPAGSPRPSDWTHLPVGAPLGHATGSITLSRITGPVIQTGPDTWMIHFNRVGFNNPRRSNDVWLLASQPGDAQYKSAVQQANLRFPLQNKEGTPQRITFPRPADVKARKANGTTIPLTAASDAGVQVQYYVQEGPAEIKGNTLILTEVPLRAKLPLKVTVVVWQYGRSVAPKLQTAEPVTRTFYLIK